jgi:hypothetical protein
VVFPSLRRPIFPEILVGSEPDAVIGGSPGWALSRIRGRPSWDSS